jgi:hypothetical protein
MTSPDEFKKLKKEIQMFGNDMIVTKTQHSNGVYVVVRMAGVKICSGFFHSDAEASKFIQKRIDGFNEKIREVRSWSLVMEEA